MCSPMVRLYLKENYRTPKRAFVKEVVGRFLVCDPSNRWILFRDCLKKKSLDVGLAGKMVYGSKMAGVCETKCMGPTPGVEPLTLKR